MGRDQNATMDLGALARTSVPSHGRMHDADEALRIHVSLGCHSRVHRFGFIGDPVF